MAIEFHVNGIVLFKEPGVFLSFEEKPDELVLNLKSLGFDLAKHDKENKLYLENIHIGRYKTLKPATIISRDCL